MLLDNPDDARTWADRHDDWSRTAAGIVEAVRNAFEVLHDIEYAAPWKADAQPRAAISSAASTDAQPSGSAASRS
jgi:hypothetical protein